MNGKNQRIKWDQRFLGVCDQISTWSACLSRQIGAVLVRDKTIIATGYNGPPRGIPHCDSVECPRQMAGHKSGEGLHLCPAAHAEQNCINNAARIGVKTHGSIMYMNCPIPCKDCLKAIINAGIREVICTRMETYDNLSNFLMQYSSVKIRTYENIVGGTISQE